jgi:hypothetical protein
MGKLEKPFGRVYLPFVSRFRGVTLFAYAAHFMIITTSDCCRQIKAQNSHLSEVSFVFKESIIIACDSLIEVLTHYQSAEDLISAFRIIFSLGTSSQ